MIKFGACVVLLLALSTAVQSRHSGLGGVGGRHGGYRHKKGGFDFGPGYSLYSPQLLHGAHYAPSYGAYSAGPHSSPYGPPKHGFHLGYEVGYQGHLGYIKLKRDNGRHVQFSVGLGKPGGHHHGGAAGALASALPYAALLPILG